MARLLDADGWHVRALVRSTHKGPAYATLIPGALEDRESLDRLVDGVQAVVHCAGLVRAATAADFAAVNDVGVERLAAAAASSPTPPRFILMSSLAAREAQLSSYGASKQAGERALARHGGALPWTVLRPPAVYGPGDRGTLDFFRLYQRGLAPLPGGDTGRLSLIHGEDLAGAVAALLGSDVGFSETFEVRDGHDEGYSWSDLADSAARAYRRPMTRLAPPRVLMESLAVINQGICGIFGSVPSLTRGKVRELYHPDWRCRDNPIARLTGWTPRFSIDQGFAQTIAWYRSEGWL